MPLTLLAMTRDTEFGVVEMGASACGELALLASVAEPNYGILTNIGLAHLEGFGGRRGFAAARANCSTSSRPNRRPRLRSRPTTKS